MHEKYFRISFKNISFLFVSSLILLGLLFFFIYVKYDLLTAVSGFCGGITIIFPYLLFFGIVFVNKNNVTPKSILKKIYLAEFFKICVLILIFGIFFGAGIYNPLCFFICLFFIQLSFWFGSFLLFMRV